jgi:predicted DNA-binding transcriptional regulator AlpA
MRKTTPRPSLPEQRNFVTADYVIEHWGVTKEWLKNARERAAFPFYRPTGTNVVFYRPQDIDAYIAEGRVI